MRASKPRYQQLKDFIIEQILSGELQPTDRVPSENELVASKRVSRMTANRALRELNDEGYVERVAGRGTFVSDYRSRSDLVEVQNNEVPIQVEDRYVLGSFAPGCLQQDFEKITPSAYLTEVAPLQEAEQSVRASVPNPAIRKFLEMTDDEPCLVVMRRTWSQGRPVTFARLHHPGSRYELMGHYTPPGTLRTATADVVQLENLRQ